MPSHISHEYGCVWEQLKFIWGFSALF